MDDNSGIRCPPPLIYLSGLAIGFILSYWFPAGFLPGVISRALAALLITGGALVTASGFRALHRAQTSMNPTKPTTAIVTEGPYRFTRNPLYLSLAMIYTGIAVVANSLWSLLLLPAVLIIIQLTVIVREEHYLERKFGQEYLSYKERVRRWL